MKDKIINRVLYGVDVPIFNEIGKVLMLKRDVKSEEFKTGWEFVKGGLKENENFIEAAFREAREEASGLELQLIGEFEKEYFVDARYRKKPHYDYVIKKVVVLYSNTEFLNIDPKEHSAFKWVDLNLAKEEIWVESGKEILEKSFTLYTEWKKSR